MGYISVVQAAEKWNISERIDSVAWMFLENLDLQFCDDTGFITFCRETGR